MNRILNRAPQDIQGWIEEILRKRPAVMDSIRNKIMKDLLIVPEKVNDNPTEITTENCDMSTSHMM